MPAAQERAALVALLRLASSPDADLLAAIEEAGSALRLLREAPADRGQMQLLPDDPEPLLARASGEIDVWESRGYRILSVLDPEYPQNLRTIHDRPPLLFVAGRWSPENERSVAVIGARRASAAGLKITSEISRALVGAGFTVVSGLAAGIDSAAHQAALDAGGRTVAVVGTGLDHVYPRQNAALQKRIAAGHAVVSRFWPETPPDRTTFPRRNVVMSGLALGTVIIEASVRSGARIQARKALGHVRPVLLWHALLEQEWARELSERPGVHVIHSIAHAVEVMERLTDMGDLEG